MTVDEFHRPVDASPEVLANLWAQVDQLDTHELTDYARALGLTPPPVPEGYQGWQVVIGYPNRDYDNGVLYWWGPEGDHGEENG